MRGDITGSSREQQGFRHSDSSNSCEKRRNGRQDSAHGATSEIHASGCDVAPLPWRAAAKPSRGCPHRIETGRDRLKEIERGRLSIAGHI
ncbi:hypothetical protein RR42_s3155 [Cupriavidus basilensis]|uniref:Uncharacterized protein n=1 Tax=Cupriavidus basilensis TaxID=68895 RepID=A0A0C4YW66_9BURK|nr:hypothetical protein RR42_s3155 [Cupriavidus basilensis]